uniref:Solute carrier family 22 member 5-like n=1 Tax=Lepisosteus oculatus TaxID=7918 RepID=W5MWD8_LEPOC|nr:PREDICTED: solute carrier family 22 member 5-like isoform X1 [Lepisosteus oculatus]
MILLIETYSISQLLMLAVIMRDYDQITVFLGDWGRFQQIVFFLLCASTIPNGFSAFSIVFLGDTPAHKCFIPASVNVSAVWRNFSIPLEEVNGQKQPSKCRRYRLDVIRNFSNLNYIPGVDVNVSEIEQESCLNGWEYSKEMYKSTVVTEYDLVCNNEWKEPLTSSIYFLGVLCGSFVSGQLSDRFGRKPVLFATMAIQTVFTFIQVFAPSWEVFCILFFIVGLGQISNYVAAFVLGTEILTRSLRVLYSSLGVCMFFALGYMMLPLMAFFIRDWRMLLIALSMPGLIYIPLWWLIPESPRWLLSQGRVAEAEAILREAARRNGITPPEVIFHPSEGEETQSKKEDANSFLDLLRTRNIRHTTLILFLVWWTLSMGYFGLSLNTSHLHGNPYLNCFISAAIEIPAYTITWIFLRYLPRRLCTSASMILGGGVLFFIQLVPQSLPILAVTLEMVGKFGMSIGTALVFAYTGELYPTVLRNTAVGSCTMVSRIGSSIAPYFIHLGTFSKYLPYIILGSLTVLAAVLTFFLPESFGKPLPETIEQMQKRKGLKTRNASNKKKDSAETRDPEVIKEEPF